MASAGDRTDGLVVLYVKPKPSSIDGDSLSGDEVFHLVLRVVREVFVSI